MIKMHTKFYIVHFYRDFVERLNRASPALIEHSGGSYQCLKPNTVMLRDGASAVCLFCLSSVAMADVQLIIHLGASVLVRSCRSLFRVVFSSNK